MLTQNKRTIKCHSLWRRLSLYTLVFVATCLCQSLWAANEALNNVNVADTVVGYDVEIRHQSPMQYLSHSPEAAGNRVKIQLRQNASGQAKQSSNTANFNWAAAFGVPLEEVTMEDLQSDNPVLELNFSKDVKFTVSNSPDNRMTIISITTPRPLFTGPAPERDTTPRNLITSLKGVDPDMSELLDRANKAMLDKEYGRAVQIFMRIREQGNDDIQPSIQELIGLTRESLGQMAHAKAEYNKYLTNFPNGDAVARVRQRLNALNTAAQQVTESNKVAARQSKGDEWRKHIYGGFTQTYYYDQLDTANGEKLTLRSALNNHLNVTARASNSHYDLKASFSGLYQKDFEFDGEEDVVNPHQITIEGRQKDWGLFARAGRQSRSSGGVLGRFDGVHAAYEINSTFTVNGVFGYPVDSQNKEYVNTDQQFYGASIDAGTLWGGWEFSGFYIMQEYLDFTDREAIGGEVRFVDANKSLFTLVDYDIFYQELNIFMVNGRWAFNEATSVNASFDHRRNPILFSYGAVQGQGIQYVEQLFPRFTLGQLYTFAENRNATTNTGTAGVTHQINSQWQLSGDITVSKYSGNDSTPTNFLGMPIEGIEGSSADIYYNTRLTTNNLIMDNDSMIFGLRYSDTERAKTTTLDFNWRANITPNLRINPRFRLDYRQSATNDDSRWQTRPKVRLDYKLRRRIRLEMDIGYDWLQDSRTDYTYESAGYYFSAGYRLQF
ncbi:hypothetical protein [Marinagarivorans algicola]|uniref:hypothetical protein n=1 Tax=Marinagarivorans algicola TaxID=1513270 RepID=UPI0037356BAF